jgi:predicted branched-subunit amino acid permease
MVALLLLDRWRRTRSAASILRVACVTLLLFYPLWILLPGILIRFVLAVPINLASAIIWPISKAQSLASAPGKAGTVSALNALFGFVPFSLLFGLLAEQITLTSATLGVHLVGLLVMFALAWRLDL